MLKVGDKIRVLRDDAYGTSEKAGTILEIVEINAAGTYIVNATQKGLRWAVSNDVLKPGFFEHVEEIKIEASSSQLAQPIQPDKGLRYNSNKLRWRNFPMFLMKPLIEVSQYGESKYDTFNFLKGQTMNDSLDSLKRHLDSFESPYESDNDSESQVNHLAHVAWNALVALHMLKTRKDLDDRYKLPTEELTEDQTKDIAEAIQQRGR